MKSNNLLAWGSAQLFFILSVMAAIVFAILSNEIEQKLHLDASDLGTLGGVFFVTYAVSQLVLGVLISRIDARYVLGPTAVLSGIGTFLFSSSDGLLCAVIARALMGIGFGSTFVGVIYLVGRRYGDNFAFMSSLSQSVTNVCGAALGILSAFLPILADFRFPFRLLGILFLVSAALIFLFVDDAPSFLKGPQVTLLDSLKIAISSSQFWAALVFYSGTFGTLLAFADLWNIQFQVDFFHHSVQQSSVMNAMLPLGVTVGGLAAGWWAGKAGVLLPSRILILLVLACFLTLMLLQLPTFLAAFVFFAIGCGFGSSTLGLAVIHQHLPESASPPGHLTCRDGGLPHRRDCPTPGGGGHQFPNSIGETPCPGPDGQPRVRYLPAGLDLVDGQCGLCCGCQLPLPFPQEPPGGDNRRSCLTGVPRLPSLTWHAEPFAFWRVWVGLFQLLVHRPQA